MTEPVSLGFGEEITLELGGEEFIEQTVEASPIALGTQRISFNYPVAVNVETPVTIVRIIIEPKVIKGKPGERVRIKVTFEFRPKVRLRGWYFGLYIDNKNIMKEITTGTDPRQCSYRHMFRCEVELPSKPGKYKAYLKGYIDAEPCS